jgi:hypothetical protein
MEHPALSTFWQIAGLEAPSRQHGEYVSHACGGFTLTVAQSAFGHECEKMTWLYFSGISPDSIDVPDYRPGTKRWKDTRNDTRHLTPMPFAKWLVKYAPQCKAEAMYPWTPKSAKRAEETVRANLYNALGEDFYRRVYGTAERTYANP